MARHPLLARREAAGRGGTRAVGLLFGAVGERMADGVVALADRVRPDLVVHEPLSVAGAEAAARRGVPAVLVEAACSTRGRCSPPSRPTGRPAA